MLRTGLAVIALTLGGAIGAAGTASAQPALDGVLSALARQGFGAFEIDREDGQVKVEARRGAIERELVWDAATGRLLKDETGRTDDRAAARDDDGQRHDRGDDRHGQGTDDDGDDSGSRSDHGDGDRNDDRNDDHGSRSDEDGGSGRGGHDDGPDDDHDD